VDSAGPTQGGGAVSPQDNNKLYAEEYHHGVNLFKRALNDYSTAQEVHKKDAFREVMDKALQVLNETAAGLKRQDLMEKNEKIKTDYDSYQASQKEDAKIALTNDLDQADKSV
jgi:hypothetical protein